MAAFEWDCDCGWELDLEPDWSGAASPGVGMPRPPPPPPPPLFDLPPPPLPPSLQPPPELCASAADHPLGLETCQAFLVSDAEYQVPLDTPPSMAVIAISVAILMAILTIVPMLCWRYRKRKEHQKALLRCQQKPANGAGVMDGVPALLQGLGGHQVTGVNDDEDGVFYDELISNYPTHFRHPNQPPAYEMKDVLFKSSSSSPCHCTAHPLLGSSHMQHQHYVTSPYHCGSHSPPSSSTPTIDEQADCSWTAEPLYEELPSGPEDDVRTPRDQRYRYRNGSTSINNSFCGQRGGTGVPRTSNSHSPTSQQSNWSAGEEAAETDFFLAPSTWYQQQQQHNNSILRGQLTTQGPVRPGRGGIRAAWRELDSPLLRAQSSTRPDAGRKKRKTKSSKSAAGAPAPDPSENGNGLIQIPIQQQPLHYQSTGLYRGKCPPEAPPFPANDAEDPQGLAQEEAPIESQQDTPTKTLPRYYYYSESDDYGVASQQRTLSNARRGHQQRHLSRAQQHRPAQSRSPTSSDNVA